MLRLLIFIGLVYLLYRTVKTLLFPKPTLKGPPGPGNQGRTDDVMVKDPMCQAYFPRRNGVPLRIGGIDYLFCSTACRDRFLEEHRGGSEE